MTEKSLVGQVSGEGDAVVALGPLDIVEVGPDEVGRHLGEPLIMIEEAEIVLEAHVSEVVPVSDLGAVRKVGLELDHFSFIRDIFVFRA